MYPAGVTGIPRWTDRLRLTSHLVHVGTFAIALVAVGTGDGFTGTVTAAAVLAGIGVVLSFAVPIPLRRGDRSALAALVGSAVCFVVAIGITGGVTSEFALMPIASLLLASFAGGARTSVPLAVVYISGVLLASAMADDGADLAAAIRLSVVYSITAVAFAEVQRALTAETERVDDLLLASQNAAERLERLEATHLLLDDLLQIATSPDVNAVAAAQYALRDVALIVPTATTRIVAGGSTNLARRGDPPDRAPDMSIPIERSGRELAHMDVWLHGTEMTPEYRSAVDAHLEHVGLALENDAMVQRLAGIAIQRERVRLARELHDDIAPSIASVGLALDMVLLEERLDDDVVRTLAATRTNVTNLVERVRHRVEDLRADRSTSLVEVAHSLVAEVDTDGPRVVVDIDERTPPRPAIAAELSSLVTEAFRNAIAHARATNIRVHGRVDGAAGTIVVEDDGIGFDAASTVTDRYGLVGMHERAGLIGAELGIDSHPGGGTTVTITWKDGR